MWLSDVVNGEDVLRHPHDQTGASLCTLYPTPSRRIYSGRPGPLRVIAKTHSLPAEGATDYTCRENARARKDSMPTVALHNQVKGVLGNVL